MSIYNGLFNINSRFASFRQALFGDISSLDLILSRDIKLDRAVNLIAPMACSWKTSENNQNRSEMERRGEMFVPENSRKGIETTLALYKMIRIVPGASKKYSTQNWINKWRIVDSTNFTFRFPGPCIPFVEWLWLALFVWYEIRVNSSECLHSWTIAAQFWGEVVVTNSYIHNYSIDDRTQLRWERLSSN